MDQSSLTGLVSCLLISVKSPFSAFSSDPSVVVEESAAYVGAARNASANDAIAKTNLLFIQAFPLTRRSYIRQGVGSRPDVRLNVPSRVLWQPFLAAFADPPALTATV